MEKQSCWSRHSCCFHYCFHSLRVISHVHEACRIPGLMILSFQVPLMLSMFLAFPLLGYFTLWFTAVRVVITFFRRDCSQVFGNTVQPYFPSQLVTAWELKVLDCCAPVFSVSNLPYSGLVIGQTCASALVSLLESFPCQHWCCGSATLQFKQTYYLSLLDTYTAIEGFSTVRCYHVSHHQSILHLCLL